MNRNYYLLIMLLIASMLTSCKKSEIEHENDFDKSYKAWQSFKTSSNNSYRYKASFRSWTGYSGETTITVNNGKVVRRSYIGKSIKQPSNEVIIHEEWTEEENALNTHQNGDATFTLDQIYEKAKTVWLVKNKNSKIYLETNNDGMISSCGFVRDNCADDCFTGIKITSITAL